MAKSRASTPPGRERRTSLRQLLGWLRPRFRPYRWVALGTLIALAVGGLLQTYPVMLVRQAVIQITDGTTSRLILLAGIFYACQIMAAAATLASSYWAACLGTGLGFSLRQQLYDHIQRLSLDFFESHQTGDLLNRSMGDVTEVQNFMVTPLTWIGDAAFTFGFALFFLLEIDWKLTLLCLPVGLLLVAVMYLIAGWIRPTFRRYRQVFSDIFSLFSENVAGIREVQAFTREDDQSARYQGTNQELRRLEVRTAVIGQSMNAAFMAIFPLATVAVLWYGGVRIHQHTLKMHDLVAFLLYAGMLIRPLRGLAGHYASLQRALISTERVMEVLQTSSQVQEPADAVDLPADLGEVVFEGVRFSYNGGQPALDGINLRVQPGQLVALVGPSGAGKTTLVKLLLRYYDPQQGRITIGGVDLRQATLRSLRGRMGVVFQDPFLFNGSLRDNIAFGRPEASEQEMMEAIRAADLEEFVQELPDGYDCLVGERGVRLSGGQRSRLAIARAMLRNPRILVLDEATAAVDTEAERRIQAALDRLIVGRTCIIIAHRLSTVLKADQIVVLSQGHLVERGRHPELVASGGLYARLYQAQFARGDGYWQEQS